MFGNLRFYYYIYNMEGELKNALQDMTNILNKVTQINTIPLKEEDKITLQNINETYTSLLIKIGKIVITKWDNEEELSNCKEEYKNLLMQDKNITSKLKEAYGENSTVDIDKGVIYVDTNVS